MSAALTGGQHGWSGGYLLTALVQGLIVAVLLLSLPLWGRPTSGNGSQTETPPFPCGRCWRSPVQKK